MIRRVIGLLIAVAAFAALFYISRFWAFRLWSGDELFGLRPQGGYVARWLRGTDFAPFELLIWAIGGFAVLTLLQRLYGFFDRDDH